MNLTVEKINSLNVSKASYFGRGKVKQELLFAKFETKELREPNSMILGKLGHGKQAISNRENGVMFFTQTMKRAGDCYKIGKKRPKKLHVDEWVVLKKKNFNSERLKEMTVFLPMNRIRDELKKVDQFRKRVSPIASFIQQASELLELEENNLGLALILAEARKKNIPLLWSNGNLKIIEVDPRGTNGEKLKELGYSMKEISLIDFNKP